MLRRGDSAPESVVPGNSAKMSETPVSDLRIPPGATNGGDPFRLVGERLDGTSEIRRVVAEAGFGVV